MSFISTRHNVGQWVFEELEKKYSLFWNRKEKLFSEYCQFSSEKNEEKLILVKPTIFMNESGKSVFNYCSFFKIKPLNILVIHDELDLMPGVVKFKFGGSSAGHRGIENIHSLLGTQDFWRLRVGIGHPRVLGLTQDVSNFVLSSPKSNEKRLINQSLRIFSNNIFFLNNKKIDQLNKLLVEKV